MLFETGYGPSGLPHIGTFGEVARTTMVRHAFQVLTGDSSRRGWWPSATTWTACARCPTTCPTRRCWPQHLGKPLSRVPDPFGTHESFAAHNNAMLRAFLDPFGFDYEFVERDGLLHDGRSTRRCCAMLERLRRDHGVMLPTLREERAATYSPFLPICPRPARCCRCRSTCHDVKAGTISFDDPDTEERCRAFP